MCFGGKVKVPKANPNQAAPEPILLEPPKGVEFGDGPADATDSAETTTGRKSLKVEKVGGGGDGTGKAVASDTGASKTTSGSAVRRALNKKT